MPLRLIGIDADTVAQTRPAIAAAESAMAAAWLTSPRPLTQVVQAKHIVTMNALRLTEKILTGKPSAPVPTPNIVLEPAWCTLMDYHVLFVTVADARTNQLLGAAHTTVARAQWAQGNGLGGRLATLARSALAQAAQKGAAPATDALHVGLDLARNTTRADEGSSLCLTLLLEEQLARDFTVARALGTDILATARDQLGQASELRRPTRRLVLNWKNPIDAGKKDPKRTLPVALDLEATRVESVLGQHIPEPVHKSRWTFSAGSGNQLGFVIDPGFRKLLDAERETLKLADAPQVAKIDRAWVYLDRGRAWGLKMNDRMITQGPNGEPIKGHVVRFFGPELKIVSPRGYPVREGAILYIRKNQRQAKLGQPFQFDPKPFPTPWPPVP